MSEEERKGAIEIIRTLYGVHRSEDYQKAFDVIIAALSAELCEDTISRQVVLDEAVYTETEEGWCGYTVDVDYIKSLPPVKPQEPCDISNDGTLTVNVEDGRKISRVLVCGANHWGGLYYPDEQEPKTGHWIMSDDGLHRPICNNCGAHPWKGYIPTVEEATKVFKYCPNCGASMESEEQGNADSN